MATKKEKEIKGEERLENVETALSKTEMWIEEHQKLIYGIIKFLLGKGRSQLVFNHFNFGA